MSELKLYDETIQETTRIALKVTKLPLTVLDIEEAVKLGFGAGIAFMEACDINGEQTMKDEKKFWENNHEVKEEK